tara:strand:- start:10788 stop:12008 length:1221 start_codon:yes stop_codon:yes gene_type:complete
MATEILVRVYTDGTGDYTSLRASVIAEATNLVTADSYIVFELKGDLRNTDAFVDFNSYTTDATRNVIIRPIDADRADGITGNTGTIYGVSTFAIVSRNKFITIDGLDFDGWSSDFFEPANTKITNSLLSNGGVRILNVASLDNTIIYDVPNQTINSIAGDVTRVTIVNKLSFYPASDFLFRSIAGAVTFCVAYNEKSGSLNYSISTNGANDFNASNDTSAPGTNSQTVATSDFTDYANNNFNIDPASPLFALGVGADLVPASGGISLTVTEVLNSFADTSNINIDYNVSTTITETLNSFGDSSVISVTSGQAVDLTVTETLGAFTDASNVNVSVNVDVLITEVLNSFLDGANVTIAKDITLQVTETFSAFTDNSSVRLPANWTDKIKVTTTYTTQTPTSTTWIDKG